jgi:hypothetical protein
MIPSEAVKCRHCGEFVDGRPAVTQAAAPPQQIVFIVDRALLGDARGGAYRLLPGRPVPADIARQLSAPTVRAIETNQPRLLDDPRVRALPAPGGDYADDDYAGGGVIDVQAEATPASGPRAPSGAGLGAGEGGRMLLPGASREVVPASRSGALPARPGDLAGAPVGRGSGGLLATFGRFLMRTAPGARSRAQAADDAIDVKPEERYRACVKCGTEILSSDNFCYHCGSQYHEAKVDLGSPLKAKRRRGNNVALPGALGRPRRMDRLADARDARRDRGRRFGERHCLFPAAQVFQSACQRRAWAGRGRAGRSRALEMIMLMLIEY